MPAALGGPRVLLRRLREIMAEPVSAQDRLDKIVVLIAANMVAEVCSVYVMRGDGTLELFATEGLNREAVHLTTMRSGEGLVGLIASTAEPLALSDAQSHPAFSYKPETGEEIYHAFLGVPLLRAGNTLGVLVVQNRTYRVYAEEEIEALQTTAMVLAEMIASGELQALAPADAGTALRRPLHQRGVSLADGVGLGYVVLHEPRVVVKNLIAENVDAEVKRLEAAIGEVRASIDELIERGDVAHHGEHREVLETFRMFAHDQGWLRRMREAVLSGLTAEAAVERVQSDNRARMLRQTDPYLRERLHDLDDLANRLLHRLVGRDLVAERARRCPTTPSSSPARWGRRRSSTTTARACAASSWRRAGRRATSPSSPARSASPPSARSSNATSLVEPGDAIIVDGGLGEVQIRPRPDVEAAYAEKARLRARRMEQYRRLRDVPAVTQDGVEITLQLNAGPPRRPAASRRDRRHRRRPLPHRAAVHGRRAHALGGRAAGALQGGVRGRRRHAGHLPHPRHRRRQDPALHAGDRGGEPGARLARHPHRPRPARTSARPDPRAPQGRGGPAAEDHVPDGGDLRRVRPRQGAGRARDDLSRPPRPRRCRPSSSSA